MPAKSGKTYDVGYEPRDRRRRRTSQSTEPARRHLAVLPGGLSDEPTPYISDPDAMQESVPVTVAIIDGRPFSCAVMELAIARTYDFEVVFSGRSTEDFEKSGVEADLVVLALLDASGGLALDAVRRLAQTKRVLVTAPAQHVPSMIDAINVGARGCLTEHRDEYEIVNALRAVAQEAIYFSAESSEYLRDRLAAGQHGAARLGWTTTCRRLHCTT
jgi:DNA-binding NarL/FixJ family response regulator